MKSYNYILTLAILLIFTACGEESTSDVDSDLLMTDSSRTIKNSINFYDDGGKDGVYSQTSKTLTLYPSTSRKKVSVTFTMLDMEGADSIKFYDGNSEKYFIGNIGGYNTSPLTITSSADNGALTLITSNDYNQVGAGWEASIKEIDTLEVLTMRDTNVTIDNNITFYDNGGTGGYYVEDRDRTLTLYPSTSGKKVSVTFKSVSMEGADYIKFYDGNTTTNIIGNIGGENSSPATITSTADDGSLTITTSYDYNQVGAGWEASITQIDELDVLTMRDSDVIINNNITFYDNGGIGGNYIEDRDRTLTLYPSTSGKKVSVTFKSVSMEGADYIKFYDGNTTTNVIGNIGGENSSPATITSTADDGSLTITTSYDYNQVGAGWEASINEIDTLKVLTMRDANVTINNSVRFYDNGGIGGNYIEDRDRTLTLYPSASGKKVSILFYTVSMEGRDSINIFNGNDTTNSIDTLSGYSISPVTITSTADDGSLTITTSYDYNQVSDGWDAVISQQ